MRVPLAGDRSLLGDALFYDARSSDPALRRPTDLARRAPRRARRGESLPSDEPRVELLDELIDPERFRRPRGRLLLWLPLRCSLRCLGRAR